MASQKNNAIGIIGIGAIGAPIAHRFLKKKYKVYLWNRTASKASGLVRKGAILCATPKEVAINSEKVVLSLTTHTVVRDVVLGKDGLLEGFSSKKKRGIIIDTSTISPLATKNLTKELARYGIDFIDAPVSGGTKRAEDGTLCILIGGQIEAVRKSRRVLKLIGSNSFYFGSSGAGQSAKLANQILVSVNALAAGEALALGSSFRLDMRKLVQALKLGSGDSTIFRSVSESIVGGKFDFESFIYLMQKDLESILSQSRKTRYNLRLSSLAHRIYREAYDSHTSNLGLYDLVTKRKTSK